MTDGVRQLDAHYRVEYWVRSNLRSHHRRPFTFSLDGAQITIRARAARANAKGFVAQVELSGIGMLVAEQRSHEILAKLLDVLCYEMRVAGRIMRNLRTQRAATGNVRKCAVYGYERGTRSLFLMEPTAAETQRLLGDHADIPVRRALYWLRWAYSARSLPEAFLFVWMAVERLAGEHQIPATCGCGAPLRCEQHGQQSRAAVPRKVVRTLLERYGVTNIEGLLRLRNPLVHGGLENNLMHRVLMRQALPQVARAVEEELRLRLSAGHALNVSPFSGPGDHYISAHCVYRTAYPDRAFPHDCPTFAEVKEYQEALRRGEQHEKIVDLSLWPPDW